MKMTKDIQIKFCELIKKIANYYDEVYNFNPELIDSDPEELANLIFSNLRKRHDTFIGKRLNYTGKQIVERLPIQYYKIILPKENKVKVKHLKWLENNLQYPYYFSNRILILFDEEHYMFLEMVDYNMDKLN